MKDIPKNQSRLGVVVMVFGFLTWILCQNHGCRLMSLWIEIPMLLSFLAVVPAWVSCASGFRRAVVRSFGAILIIVGVQSSYLTLLHSDYFPKWLLFPKARIQHRAPNHALQRTRPSRRGCNRGVPRAGSLSLGR